MDIAVETLKSQVQPPGAAPETPKTATLEHSTDLILLIHCSQLLPRYNAMLAVLRNTLYIYGGIYERGPREYTLHDFYALQLDKMDKYICLKLSQIGDVENSSDEDEDDDSDDDDDDGDDEEDEEERDGDGHNADEEEVVENAVES
ncbi:hypothetical protein BYT27DRAFT_6955219 [Phlegmacium glaucopus]|nr:hypothetical protein BYT27DRAFT_6955219 [Phlegmacium glaucopus]